MRYPKEAVQAAYSELDRRRQTAMYEFDSRLNEIKNDAPEIYEIYLKLTKTKDYLAEIVFSKRTDVRPAIEAIKKDNLSNQKKLKDMLAAFGYPEDYLTVKYRCQLCRDTGIANGNLCKCVEELMTGYTIKKHNEQCKIKLHSFAEFIPDYYPESISYKGTEVKCREKMMDNLKYCMSYADNFSLSSPGIFMLGGTGLGKTFLSSCIAGELLRKGVSVAFDSIQNYLRDIEKEHFGKTEGDTLEILLNADLLILDDLGCEFPSPFNTSTIYNIINSRCNMGKPTIVSSNLGINELSERYDDRIISRLTGNFYTLRFIGEDIRQIKRRNGIFE